MRAQLNLEALVVFSAFLAFLLLLAHSLAQLGEKTERFSDELSARECAANAAELAGYYALDGLHSHFPLEILGTLETDGKAYCTRGNVTATSKVLVVEDGKEPI